MAGKKSQMGQSGAGNLEHVTLSARWRAHLRIPSPDSLVQTTLAATPVFLRTVAQTPWLA